MKGSWGVGISRVAAGDHAVLEACEGLKDVGIGQRGWGFGAVGEGVHEELAVDLEGEGGWWLFA